MCRKVEKNMMKENNTGNKTDKALLSLDEFCVYLGIGETKARELLTKTNNPYTVRIGNRLYANKLLLDKWLNSVSGNKVKKQRKENIG